LNTIFYSSSRQWADRFCHISISNSSHCYRNGWRNPVVFIPWCEDFGPASFSQILELVKQLLPNQKIKFLKNLKMKQLTQN